MINYISSHSWPFFFHQNSLLLQVSSYGLLIYHSSWWKIQDNNGIVTSSMPLFWSPIQQQLFIKCCNYRITLPDNVRFLIGFEPSSFNISWEIVKVAKQAPSHKSSNVGVSKLDTLTNDEISSLSCVCISQILSNIPSIQNV